MRKFIRPSLVVGVAVVLACGTMVAHAQERGGGNRGRRAQADVGQGQERGATQERGQRPQGGFDPAAMQARMLEGLKEKLGTSDEEWKAIGPLVENVMDKQRETRMGGMGRGMRMGGRGGRGGSDAEANPELDALRQALESESTEAAVIKSKLEAVRQIRKKNEDELKKAREELRQVLTVRQEANLVLIGMLD
ncbi:MAG: hypothetical protein ABIH23_26660 [bacterium]